MSRHGPDCGCRSCRSWYRMIRDHNIETKGLVRRVSPNAGPIVIDTGSTYDPPLAERVYVVECQDCGPGTVVKTFDTAGERNRWAWEHATELGHAVRGRTRKRLERTEYPEAEP